MILMVCHVGSQALWSLDVYLVHYNTVSVNNYFIIIIYYVIDGLLPHLNKNKQYTYCFCFIIDFYLRCLYFLSVFVLVSDPVDEGSDKTLPTVALSKWEKVDSESSGILTARRVIHDYFPPFILTAFSRLSRLIYWLLSTAAPF